jgi:DNA-binding HxlR family transcriptional regulator
MTEAQIIALIEQHPQGLTSAQAAAITGANPNTIATRLSKLADYGKISRRQVSQRPPANAALWLPKSNGAAT